MRPGCENGVTLTRDERRETILTGARQVCADAGLNWWRTPGFWRKSPVLLSMARGDPGRYGSRLPGPASEVIQLTMKTHQKYFAVEDADGEIAPQFVVIANRTPLTAGPPLQRAMPVFCQPACPMRAISGTWTATRAWRPWRANCPGSPSTTSWARSPTRPNASRRWRASSPRPWARIRSSPSSLQSSPRPIWSARWSMNSPSCRA